MKVLYLDCFSGISGDMTVGALCDLGVKPSTLEWELSKVEIGDFHMHFERKHRLNVEGVAFSIHSGATHQHEEGKHAHDCGHDHGDEDHDHGHGEEHAHTHEHSHEHSHAEEHEHSHGHAHESEPAHAHKHEEEHGHGHDEDPAHHPEPAAPLPPHDHEHGDELRPSEHHHHHDEHAHHHQSGGHVHGRSHQQIRELIEKSELTPYVKGHALSIFHRIAVAEGKIHGMPPEKVEFHEVGALDSIADIICVCVGMETLGVEKVYVSELHDGTGWVDCAHGRFPLPAPATLEILRGITLSQIDEPCELITPTGAAIAAEFSSHFGLMPRLRVDKIGYGVGQRHLIARPNVLRAVLGELSEP